MKMEELVWLERGTNWSIALTPEVAASLDAVDAKARARIRRYMKHFSTAGPTNLHKEVYRFEGRFPLGLSSGKKHAIYAFKGWQVRVYGGVIQVGGKGTFVGTEIESSKKKDKANKKLLTQAAQKLGELLS